VSYAILAKLQKNAEKGDMVAIVTLNDPHSADDYFRFIMILAILHRQNTAVKDVKTSKASGRRIYKVQYYIDGDGTPIMLNLVAQTKNKDEIVVLCLCKSEWAIHQERSFGAVDICEIKKIIITKHSSPVCNNFLGNYVL
jgi:hypothetical protein